MSYLASTLLKVKYFSLSLNFKFNDSCFVFFITEYMNKELNPYFGMTIGRVTNRISNAQFDLDHQTYYLDKNNGNNYLHGGFNGLNWVT